MDIVKEHREKCTYCGKCLEVCPRYDDLRLIEDLYRYLEGSLDIDYCAVSPAGSVPVPAPRGLESSRLSLLPGRSG